MDFVRNLSVDELRTFYDGLSETRRKMPNIVRMLRDAQVQLGVVDFLPLEEEQEESDSAPNSEGSADADNGRAESEHDHMSQSEDELPMSLKEDGDDDEEEENDAESDDNNEDNGEDQSEEEEVDDEEPPTLVQRAIDAGLVKQEFLDAVPGAAEAILHDGRVQQQLNRMLRTNAANHRQAQAQQRDRRFSVWLEELLKTGRRHFELIPDQDAAGAAANDNNAPLALQPFDDVVADTMRALDPERVAGGINNLNDVRERFNELTNVMHQFKKNGNVAIARQHVINTRYFLCLGELFRRFQRMHRALRLRGSVHDAFFERIFGRDSNTSRAAFKNKVTAAATLAELAITFHVLRYATVSVGKLIQFHTELRRLLATASNDGIRWRNNLLTPAIHQGVQQFSDEDHQRLQTFIAENVFVRQQNAE